MNGAFYSITNSRVIQLFYVAIHIKISQKVWSWKSHGNPLVKMCMNPVSGIYSWVGLGVGDMAKIFYHGMSNFISRLRYISRYSNCSVNSIKKWYKITIPYFIITLDYLLQTKTTASHETTLELKTKDSNCTVATISNLSIKDFLDCVSFLAICLPGHNNLRSGVNKVPIYLIDYGNFIIWLQILQ